jgi:transcription elongation factor Elf1
MQFKMLMRPERDVQRELQMFKKPAAYQCPFCEKYELFRLLVDTVGDSNLAMIGCAGCKRWTRPFEMKAPQMSDERAQAMGIWVPPKMQVDIDLDY